MAGLKERRLKRYQRGEEKWNPAVAQILEDGSIGHDDKRKVQPKQKGSGNPRRHAQHPLS